ncbi:MAG: tetratricopeptide repeat protein [Acidobacteria bacterium]|nr:tetratricopeptide repeat protein [Acidobacteriota bacterium]
MNNDLMVVRLDGRFAKAFVAAAVLMVLIFAFSAVRIQIGNMFADLTDPSDENADQISALAQWLSPYDPQASWLKALVAKTDFRLVRSDSVVELMKETVRLAPYDFRWWVELGRAYEQSGDTDDAEAALKHAKLLAPSSIYTSWQLGNFYLRTNRPDEAFNEFRYATLQNHIYREQVFSLAWDYFEKDPAKLEAVVANDPGVFADLAMFYAARGQAADALRVWSSLTDEQKAEYPQLTRVMAQGLYDKRFFAQSLAFANQSNFDPDARPEAVTNGGFEGQIRPPNETLFDWKVVRSDGKVDISQDQSVKYSGSKSMRLNFRSYTKAEFYNLFQTVVVEPKHTYKLRFWLRTEGLKSGGTPQIEVINANDDKLIAATSAFAQGTNDWQEITLEVPVPENCDGITIRTARSYCGENCPLIGTIWYDDFVLVK